MGGIVYAVREKPFIANPSNTEPTEYTAYPLKFCTSASVRWPVRVVGGGDGWSSTVVIGAFDWFRPDPHAPTMVAPARSAEITTTCH